jgi:hypothetical protein
MKRETIPYIYEWTQISTGKKYLGSKAKRGWNPSRHMEYICSSKVVKPMILGNPNDWKYEILEVAGPDECAYIADKETYMLQEVNARDNPLYFNQHNNDGIFSRVGVPHTEETRKTFSLTRTGKNHWSNGKEDAYGYMRTNNPMFDSDITKQFSEAMSGDKNPMKNTKSVQKMAETRRTSGVAKGDKNPMSRPEHQKTCEYCGKTTHKGLFTRWHGENCKMKGQTNGI